jgi:drug/metabolite transporter (DMT)-like permease
MVSHTERQHETSPLLYLTTAVLTLSTVTPVMKEVVRHGELSPFEVACLRILIAFTCLFLVTMAGPWKELVTLPWVDVLRLTLLGILGVGLAYGLAGWALFYTSVTHYSLLYSLNPSFTALFSFLMKRDRPTAWKIVGICLSITGCILAIPEGFHDLAVGFGDLLVLLFTIAASSTIVLSTGMVKRYGAATATTVMFGSGLFFLLLGTMVWSVPYRLHLTFSNSLLIAYIGIATAAVFFLRNLSLRFLPPTTVGAFHNLTPIFGILLAYLFLDETVTLQMIIGGTISLAGVELVRRDNGSGKII